MRHILIFNCLHYYLHSAVSSVIFKTFDFVSEIFDSGPMTLINQIALNLTVRTVSEIGGTVFALLSSHVRSVGVIQQNKMCEEPGNSSGCDYCTDMTLLLPDDHTTTTYTQETFLWINIHLSFPVFSTCPVVWWQRSLQLPLLN